MTDHAHSATETPAAALRLRDLLEQRLQAIEQTRGDADTWRRGARFRPRRILLATIAGVIVLVGTVAGWWWLDSVRSEQRERIRISLERQRVNAAEAERRKIEARFESHTLEFLNTYHGRAARSQDAGRWTEAGNLLAGLARIGSQSNRKDPSFIELFHPRFANQWIRHTAPASDDLRHLATASNGRFQLKGESSKSTGTGDDLFVIDSYSGAIVTSFTVADAQEISEEASHFLSSDGRDAVVVKSGRALHWSAAGDSAEELPLKMEDGASILSIVQEGSSNRFAIATAREESGKKLIELKIVTPQGQEASITLPDEPAIEDPRRIRLISLHAQHLVFEFDREGDKGLITWSLADKPRLLVESGTYQGRLGPVAGLLAVTLEPQRCRADQIDSRSLPEASGRIDYSAGRCLVFFDTETGGQWMHPLSIPVQETPSALDVEESSAGHLSIRLFFKRKAGWTKWEGSVAFRRPDDDRPRRDLSKRLVFGAPPQHEERVSTLTSVHEIKDFDELNASVGAHSLAAELDPENQRLLFAHDSSYWSFPIGSPAYERSPPGTSGCGRMDQPPSLTTLERPFVIGTASRAFIAVDDERRIWRTELTAEAAPAPAGARPEGPTASRMQAAARCIAATVRVKKILAVHSGSGRALVQTESDGLAIWRFDLQDNKTLDEPSTQVVLQSQDEPQFAAFAGERQLVVLTSSGHLEIFREKDRAWTGEAYRKAFGTGIGLAANGTHVAVLVKSSPSIGAGTAKDEGDEEKTAKDGPDEDRDNTDRVAMVLDISTTPRVVGAGILMPINQNLLGVEADGGAIRTADDSHVFTYRLSAVPPAQDLGDLVENRSLAPKGDESELLELARGLLQGERKAASAAIPCELAVHLLLEAWEASVRGSETSSADRDTRRRLTAESCKSQAAASGRHLVYRILEAERASLQSAVTGAAARPSSQIRWPEAWSRLLAAPKHGEAAGLRALALALRSDSDPLMQAAGEELSELLESGVLFVSDERLAQIAKGGPLASAFRDAVQGGHVKDARAHLALGFDLERSTTDVGRMEQALVHFLVAERAYQAVGATAAAEMASNRRAALAAALPDAHVKRAVVAAAAAWQQGLAATLPAATSSEAADDVARLQADLARLAESSATFGAASGTRLLRLIILRALAEQQEKSDPQSAMLSHRAFADLLFSDKELLQQSYAAESVNWLEARLGASDPERGFRLRLEQIALSETVQLARRGSIDTYQQALQSALDLLKPVDASLQNDPGPLREFRFKNRPFQTANIESGQVATPIFASTFRARLQLIEKLLSYAPERRDLVVQRGITHFWLGLSLAARSAGEPKNPAALAHFRSAAADLAPIQQDDSNEAKYILANAYRMAYGELEDGKEKLQTARAAVAAYRTLPQVGGPIWPSPSDFFSQHAFVVKAYGAEVASTQSLAEARESGKLFAAVLDVLYHASEWERVRRRALTNRGRRWGLEPNSNGSLANAVGYLAGHLRMTRNTASAADECDTSASFRV